MKLFIIGNGFDLSHRMKTNYCYFREFLLKKYPYLEKEVFALPESHTDRDGEIVPDKKCASIVIYRLLEELQANEKKQKEKTLWNRFESYLGRFNYSDLFNIFEMREDHENEYFNQCLDLAEEIKLSVPLINEFFSEWIEQISLTKEKEIFRKLFSDDSLFLTFNYTPTLEELYGIKDEQICHIHGKQGKKIIIGHNEESFNYDDMDLDGISSAKLSETQEILRKRVDVHYSENTNFFSKVAKSEITDIYSIGFSFSKVDLYYIKQLCRITDTEKIRWHLTNVDKKRRNLRYFKKQILKCGFNGRFGKMIKIGRKRSFRKAKSSLW